MIPRDGNRPTEWTGFQAQNLTGRQPKPSVYYTIFLALIDDRWGRQSQTPFTLLSPNLAELGSWIALVASTPPSLHGYFERLSRHNDLASRAARFAHCTIVRYKDDVNEDYMRILDEYIAVVVYLQGSLPALVGDLLSMLRVRPIIICEAEDAERQARLRDFVTFNIRDIDPARLRASVGDAYIAGSERLPEGPIRQLFEEFLRRARFQESDLPQQPRSGELFQLPNEVLLNALRGRGLPPGTAERPDRANAVQRTLSVVQCIFGHKLIDYSLENPPIDHVSPEFNELIETLKRDGSADSYERTLQKAIVESNGVPNACAFMLCCPSGRVKS